MAPVLFAIVLWYNEKLLLNKAKIITFLVFFHYTRRSLESLFVHISNKNVKYYEFFGFCIYYWFLFGAAISCELSK